MCLSGFTEDEGLLRQRSRRDDDLLGRDEHGLVIAANGGKRKEMRRRT